ncbi:hypothetical protein AAKU61_002829 [Undibacterium sp. GrIS 1.2]
MTINSPFADKVICGVNDAKSPDWRTGMVVI